MPMITLFHATCDSALTSFQAARIGSGGDANSALGIHFAERPEDTVRYVTDHRGSAARGARVLIVEADVSRALLTFSSNDFFGLDGEGNQVEHHEDFAARREALLADGWDAVCTEGGTFDEDGAGVWVILDPARLRVVGEMPLDEALESGEESDYSGVEITAGTIFASPSAPIP